MTRNKPKPKLKIEKRENEDETSKALNFAAALAQPSAAGFLASSGGPYPPTISFMIDFCSRAENRTVADHEHFEHLHNVNLGALNGRINATYHNVAGVALYPLAKPDKEWSLRAAAVDLRDDFETKGVKVSL